MDSSVISVPAVLNLASLALLETQIEKWKATPQKLLILTGEEKERFCHGLDFQEIIHLEEEVLMKAISRFIDILCFLKEGSFLSFACISGSTIGGGVGLVAACDFVVANESSSFQLSEGLFGLIPGVIYPILCQRIPLQIVKNMVLTSHAFSALTAKEFGLIDEILTEKKSIKYWMKTLNRCHLKSIQQIKSLANKAEKTEESLRDKMLKGGHLLKTQLREPKTKQGLLNFLHHGELPWLGGTT